ncbi:CYTH and CHAD domain-containing protein [Amycolatopsis rhabdoformis]|uniref:CYTH and CHAD domain-containing protein n=1 Tax=Amycolatopsis rhabdoformis TaxID=1448059 RepID=A0ABZ1IAC6_9PSEU|nr:CYTH and CHAD domain-containing protein [Amycolatopsis rhabdoformis]WSE31362.1 CYTH and CHAD domain-containing protein [Amycolatopsis rhabdoformis]
MNRPVVEIERERKYEVAQDVVVPEFVGGGTVQGQDAPAEEQLDATYYDTAAFSLIRAGITLRRRSGGHDAGWHLKLPVGPDEREELQLPLGENDELVPRELNQLLRAYTLGRKLLPIAHLKTDRFAHRLTDASGQVVATVTDDHVTGEVGGRTARLDRWRELEVELAGDAAPELLDELQVTLVDAGARVSLWPSKLRRLIGDRVPNGRPERKRPDAGEVVGAYLREQLAALQRADVGVRRDVEDSVHQLRVASRKLRSASRTFSSLVDDKRVAGLGRELKWLGGELSPARDGEVVEALVREWVAGASAELVVGPVDQYLTRRFSRDAVAAREKALKTLQGKRYLALVQDLDAVVAGVGPGRGAKSAKKALREPVRKAARKLRKAEKAARGLSGEEQQLALHAVRKKAKRARYAADVVRPVFGAKVRAWRKNVKGVQQVLGDHQDWVVAGPVVYRLGVDGQDEGVGFAFGVLYGSGAGKRAELRQEFTSRWKRLEKGTAPKWL